MTDRRMTDNQSSYEEHRAWVLALVYAQAYMDEPGGVQTIKAHLPEHDEDLILNEATITDIIDDLNIECSTIVHRFIDGKWGTRVLEVGSSEGHHGLPDWV